jgi:hypothetical protein
MHHTSRSTATCALYFTLHCIPTQFKISRLSSIIRIIYLQTQPNSQSPTGMFLKNLGALLCKVFSFILQVSILLSWDKNLGQSLTSTLVLKSTLIIGSIQCDHWFMLFLNPIFTAFSKACKHISQKLGICICFELYQPHWRTHGILWSLVPLVYVTDVRHPTSSSYYRKTCLKHEPDVSPNLYQEVVTIAFDHR